MSRRRKMQDPQEAPVIEVQEVQTTLMHCGQRMSVRTSMESDGFRIRYWVCPVCQKTAKTAYECVTKGRAAECHNAAGR